MDITGKKVFKTSVVGGFNRGDVLNYIENTVNIHNAEVSELKDSLKASADENVELKQKNEELSEKLFSAESKIEELTALLQEKSAVADRVGELEEISKTTGVDLQDEKNVNSQLRSDIDALRARVEKYEAMEDEYSSNKSRLAELELSALARASELEKAAQSRADELEKKARERYAENEAMIEEKRRETQAEINKIMADLSAVYNRLITEINGFSNRFDDVINSTKNNLQILNKSTGGITANFAGFEQTCRRFFREEEVAQLEKT